MGAEVFQDLFGDDHERQHPFTGAGRGVGQGVDRPQVGAEEDVEGPAAVAALRLDEVHQVLVDVGPGLPVHLDADEIAVEKFGAGRIGKGFAGHHMAPVAGRVADRNEKRLFFGSGRSQRFDAPFLPPHRVVAVLPEVGRSGTVQVVALVVDRHEAPLSPYYTASKGKISSAPRQPDASRPGRAKQAATGKEAGKPYFFSSRFRPAAGMVLSEPGACGPGERCWLPDQWRSAGRQRTG